jgi:gluconate 2-dehydrogenase gamma chain
MPRRVSRREMIRRAVVVGAATTVPLSAFAQDGRRPSHTYVNLSAEAARTLEAIVARLIPSDANGPGALEAGAARYIDIALGDALADFRAAYAAGLAAVDAHARRAHGKPLTELGPEQQDGVLRDLEENRATGFAPSAAAFFDLVLGHTLEGTFSDPHYGGNRDFIGWDLVGYPGIKLAVAAEDQRFDSKPQVTRVSAYDLPMFEGTGGESHDD